MRTLLLLLLMLIVSNSIFCQVKLINPPGVSTPKGYSHAAEIDLGKSKMLLISGQVALDVDGNVVGEKNFEQQTEQVFQNIQAIVEHSGGSMNDLVKITIYLRNVSNITKFREIRDKFINVNAPPASTLVEVTDLARDEFLLEVEAIAVIVKK